MVRSLQEMGKALQRTERDYRVGGWRWVGLTVLEDREGIKGNRGRLERTQ